MSKTILVTGGCGYIGSHTIVDLIENGYNVISVDDNSRSYASMMDGIHKITGKVVVNYNVDMTHDTALRQVFIDNPAIIGVIHFAAYKAVGESVAQPLIYYKNNLISLLNLLQCCDEFNVRHVVFSSSCTVYGTPDSMPVSENTPTKTANCPYGATKQMGEQILTDFTKRDKNNQQVCILRYFNPAGAHPSLHIGEVPKDGIQSLTAAIMSVASGRKPGPLQVFGNDYDTQDGTCVRDFIHVCDIATAHTCALDFMIANSSEVLSIFNLGKGLGNTVMEAIYAFEHTSNTQLNYTISERRPGDIEAIYADNSKARLQLNWMPQYSLNDIMKTAWKFECKLKDNSL